jgi:hypothetical protein
MTNSIGALLSTIGPKTSCKIEDDATVSAGEGGAWVHAWVWVSNDQAGMDDVSGPE